MDAHYGLVSKERGYQVKPPEPLMNQLGYSFLQQKDFERAFFSLRPTYSITQIALMFMMA